MSLKSINPTNPKTWSKLKDHFNDIKDIHIHDHFISESDRSKQFSICLDNFHFDFSKNKITSKTISLFNELLNEIKKWDKMFQEHSDLIFLGKSHIDIENANKEKKIIQLKK